MTGDRPAEPLQPHHLQMLKDSAIADEVIEVRGYRTMTVKAELLRLGFRKSQLRVPALLLPVHNVQGQVALHQIRPDSPRVKNGRTIKYETQSGARLVVDVPPAAQDRLGDPHVRLFVTEGVKKADSLVSHGECAVDLLGVYCWRGTNEYGGKTALPDWECIALNGRSVFLVFDGDLMVKLPVYQALSRLKAFLENRGADIRVVYLPAGDENNGAKVGVDDFLAQGHDVQDLLQLADADLRPPPASSGEVRRGPYLATPDGMFFLKSESEGGTTRLPLTNFTATIRTDLIEDDGVETRRQFKLEAVIGNRKRSFSIPASSFNGMNWVTEKLGANARILPGPTCRDRARDAVQALSDALPESRLFTHSGWRMVDGEWLYLHAAGAIGAEGTVDDVLVRLEPPLDGFALPDPPAGDELVSAVRSSLDLLGLAPDRVMFPLLTSVFRAVHGLSDFSVHLHGPTGAGKTELSALAQQHFGAGLNARNLPGSWNSTANALEAMAFSAKDALFVVDDYAPTGGHGGVEKLHRQADRLLRAQGNRAGRSRMRSDTTLRRGRAPRGLILSTGEDIPPGASLRARILSVEVAKADVDFQRLTLAQSRGGRGDYAVAMAGYVCWLAHRYADVHDRFGREQAGLRDELARDGRHRRVADIAAGLLTAFDYFTGFSQQVGAITSEGRKQLRERARTALQEVAEVQDQHHHDAEPASNFVRLLRSALLSGRCHVAKATGGSPDGSGSWGWRRREEYFQPEPLGGRIGWVADDDLYLDLDAAYAAARSMGRSVGVELSVSATTLTKRLHEGGHLRSTDGKHLKVRRTVEGRRRRVLHLRAGDVSEELGHVGRDAEEGLTALDGASPSLPTLAAHLGPGGGPVGQVVDLGSGPPDGAGSRSGSLGPLPGSGDPTASREKRL